VEIPGLVFVDEWIVVGVIRQRQQRAASRSR
jgi:hypothetical protein